MPVTPSARIDINSDVVSFILRKRYPEGSTSIFADAALFIESEFPSTFQPPIVAPLVTFSFPVVIVSAAIASAVNIAARMEVTFILSEVMVPAAIFTAVIALAAILTEVIANAAIRAADN